MTIADFAGGAGAALLALASVAPTAALADTNCQSQQSQAKLHLIVQGVRNAKGVMTATLYGDDPHRFLKGAGELKVWREPAVAPVTEMCLWLPGAGTYAVAVYHDAKRAMRFTQGAFGRPTQAYGFSRNPHIFLLPPSLAAVKFPAAVGETTIVVKLKSP